MDKKFLKENFDKHCLHNFKLLKTPIKGIVIYLSGCGHVVTPSRDLEVGPFCAENSILYLYPLCNPHCWMNNRALKQVEATIECAMELFGIQSDIPIGLHGGSMGGYSAFHYALKSKYNIVAVDLNCPCCNMEYEIYCNQLAIIRTYYESAIDDTDDFNSYVRENSPVNMVEKLPKIPYRFAVGLNDTVLIPSQHSSLMIEKMLGEGHDVIRVDYPSVAHCNLTFENKIEGFSWLCEKVLGK